MKLSKNVYVDDDDDESLQQHIINSNDFYVCRFFEKYFSYILKCSSFFLVGSVLNGSYSMYVFTQFNEYLIEFINDKSYRPLRGVVEWKEI